ncbi:uncharacterized protein LOC129610763 [Condylostylus longicornis]|uniref:uncharacterized protein LOC129610763 n=1 Tax=Condylostylus longicornis TaxID=2530218 RepID=UPI00244E491C|nr:uncharacterized protein LOC129610763 [Condylostylus longicornis]
MSLVKYLSGIIKEQSYHPVAQQTVFGWIVTGPGAMKTLKNSLISTLDDIDPQVKQFWAAEEIPKNEMVKEDEECEAFCEATTQRNNEGRYIAFIEDYKAALINNDNHMKRCDIGNQDESYLLPHHAVIKEESATTKLRVVFDGSSKSQNNISINDFMRTNPKLQQDLTSVTNR